MKKIILGLIASVLCIGMVGSAFAYFTDVETSTGNTFTVGTLDLQIADTDEWFGDGISRTWTMSNMAPGVTTVGPFSVNLHNSGNIQGDYVEIGFSHVIDELSNPVETDSDPNSTPGEMAKWIEITAMSYDTINFMTAYQDVNGNGIFDLEDVTLAPYTDDGGLLDNLPAPSGTGIRTFTLALRFNELATNDVQGDALTTTVSFTLNQDVSQ
jgi:predicted ribosomally synthesized peptide with SipW-like signal peptide